MSEELKQEVVKLLEPFYFMSTIREGHPRTRPMGLVKLIDGKLYSGMIETKEVYKEILADPHMEFSACPDGRKWVRVRGTAVWETDPAVIARIEAMIQADMAEKFGGKLPPAPPANRPTTRYFYLDECTAEIHGAGSTKLVEF